MARLSPLPSGSSRRLSELLEEQQEPFSLHLYLLDKGYSPTLLDAAGGSASAAAASTCWPRSRRTSPLLRRMVASRKTRVSGLFGLLLSKILRGTATTVAAKKKKKLRPAAIDYSAVNGEKTPSNLKNATLSSPLRAVEADGDEAEDEEQDEDDDDDDDSSKQLSPVSVLEQRTFEQARPAHAKKAMVIIRDLLDSANSPALLDQLLDKDRNNKFKDDRSRNHTPTTTTAAPAPAPKRTGRTTGAANWEEMFEAELAKVHDLIASDMACARVGLGDVRSGRWDVGAELAVTVLEALTEEIAVELMGMDRDDAIDN